MMTGSDGEPEPTAPLPLSTDHLADGRYELAEVLGSGGMGLVRRAHDHRLGRSVAIKLLADNLAADPVARERFLREARAAAAIADPNVVAVYDVGDEAGRPYLVMELVNGPSLAAVLRDEGPLPVSRVTAIAADALSGLEATHAAGIVHRDIKPGNLLQTPSGRVKLTDLGVAEAADAPGLTRTGMVVGTRTYLAPERRAGGVADVRTDLYALGVTFAELLFGPPDDPKARTEEATWLPSGLRTLILHLLAGDPAHRPVSAAAARKLLDAGRGRARARPTSNPTQPVAPALATASNGEAEPTHALEPQTQVLPQDTDSHRSGPDVHRSSPDVHRSGPDVSETAPVSNQGTTTTPGPSARWWMVGVAAFLALGLLVSVLLGDPADGGNDEPTEQAPAEVEDAPRVPRDDDPATTARNLAEWLRDR
jgi:eukaryotic-like serine/threonine-protein kinase